MWYTDTPVSARYACITSEGPETTGSLVRHLGSRPQQDDGQNRSRLVPGHTLHRCTRSLPRSHMGRLELVSDSCRSIPLRSSDVCNNRLLPSLLLTQVVQNITTSAIRIRLTGSEFGTAWASVVGRPPPASSSSLRYRAWRALAPASWFLVGSHGVDHGAGQLSDQLWSRAWLS